MILCLLADARSIHTLRWARHFLHAGWTVVVLSLASGEIGGVRVIELKTPPGFGKWRYCFAVPQVRRTLRELKPDVVHAHYISSYGLLGALAGWRPLILSCWGSDLYEFPHRSALHKALARYAAGKADLLVAESQRATRTLVDALGARPERIRTFSWGIDVDFFLRHDSPELIANYRRRLGIADGTKVVVSPRGMKAVYETPTIVRAIPEVVKLHPDTVFVLLRGFGNERDEMEAMKLADKLGVRSKAIFVRTPIEPEEMRRLLKASDIVVSVPRSDDISSALLEGMLCGPVPIASAIETNQELIEDGANGFTAPVGDAAALAERICHVLSGLPEYKLRFGSRNRERVLSHYAWARGVQRMESVYAEAVGNTQAACAQHAI